MKDGNNMAFGAKIKLSVNTSGAAAFRREIQQYVDNATASNPIYIRNLRVTAEAKNKLISELKAALRSNSGITVNIKAIDASQALTNLRTQLETMLSGLSITGLREFLGTEGVEATYEKAAANAERLAEANEHVRQKSAAAAANMNMLKNAQSTLSSTFNSISKIDGMGGSESRAAQINSLIARYEELNAEIEKLRASEGTGSKQAVSDIARKVVALRQETAAILETDAAAKKAAATQQAAAQQSVASDNQIIALKSRVQRWIAANSNAYKEYGASIDAILSELGSEAGVTDERLKQLRAEFESIGAAAASAGKTGRTFFEMLGNTWRTYGSYAIVSRVVMGAIRAVKSLITNAIELDSAFTQLRIVTNATDAEMSKFSETATNLAKELGASVSDVAKSVETFSRLGYNLADASELSKYATILGHVASVGTDEATTGITSIIKGYNMDVSEAEHVSDVLVNVGQKYAVSASEMMEAYEKSGAALNATNTSFEKSAGLIAAANASVQNASTVGTALKTVSARIRGSKSELEELGESTEDLAGAFSKYAKEIKALTGFDIMVEGTKDQFKDIYDIFDGIAAAWDKLSDTQQARVAEILGGTRQLQVISSIIGNWGDAAAAYNTAMNSVGASTQANDIYMQSAQAHIDQFKATFQEMAQTLVSSGVISFFVDVGGVILSAISALSKLRILLPSIISLVLIFQAISISRIIKQSTAQVSLYTASLIRNKGATSALNIEIAKLNAIQRRMLVSMLQQRVASGDLTSAEYSQIMATISLEGVESGLTTTNYGLAASFKEVMASIPVFGWIALGVSVLISVLTAISSTAEETAQSLEDINEEINRTQSEIEQISNDYRNLKQSAESVIPRFVELADGVDEFGHNVRLTDDEYSEFLDLNNKIAEMFPELNMGMDSNGNAMLALSLSADTLRESLESLLEVQRLEAAQQQASKLPELAGDISKYVDRANSDIGEIEDKIGLLKSGKTQRSLSNNYSDMGSSEADRLAQEYLDGVVDLLKQFNIKYDYNIETMEGTTTTENTLTWDADSSAVSNAIAGYNKAIDEYKAKIVSKWKSANAAIKATLQSDFLYNDLPEHLQMVANAMVSGLNFSELGLIGKDGDETANNIKNYIYNNIISPLYSASPEVRDAIESLFKDFKSGSIDEEAFAAGMRDIFNTIIESLDEKDVANFKNMFVAGFNEMGIAGGSFGAVVDNIIQAWINSSGVEDSIDSKISKTEDLVDATTSLSGAYNILSKAQKEMAEGGLSLETIKSVRDALADSEENYLDYLYVENGVIKLNTEAWRRYSEEKQRAKITDLETELDELKQERERTQELYEEMLPQANSGNIGAQFMAGDAAAHLSELNSQIEETEKELDLLTVAFNDAGMGADVFSRALNSFTEVNTLIDGISNSFTHLADVQELVANGFVMSLDKALEFAEIYPEILNNAKLAADGQIELDEAVVNAFLESKEAELRGEIDAKIAELEAKKDVLEAQKAFSEAELELAKNVGEGEGQITKEVAQFRLDTGNQLTAALIEAGVDEATAFQMAAAAMAGNASEFNRIAKDVCTDVDGNFNKAAYSAAQAIYNNMNSAKIDVASLGNQAKETAKAIASMAKGVAAGDTSIKGGSGGGSMSGGASLTLSGAEFKGTDYTYEAKTIDLKDFISNLELDISNYNSAISQIEGQIHVLEALKNTNLDKFSSSYKNASKNSGGGSGGSSGSSEKVKTWFEEQYAYHKHLVAMEQETDEAYFKWLESAFKRAYNEGIISLEDYRKYEEEVYKGHQSVFKDHLSDLENEASLRENFTGESKTIVKIYKNGMSEIEKEIKAARARGLKDTDDYIQELQKKWFSYKDSIKDLEEDITENAKDAVQELVDIRIKMLKQDIDDQKDAIKKKLDALKEFYDKQKEMLQDVYDEEKYLEEQAEKRKSVADIQAQMAQLEYDDSAWAQKRKLELAEELSDAQKELKDFERDHALEVAQEELDKLYEMQEKELNAQSEALDSKQKNAKELYDQALKDIKNGSVQLYNEMIEWNNVYGDGIASTITSAWEEAYKALKDYKDYYGKAFDGVKLANATGYVAPKETYSNTSVTKPKSTSSSTSSSSSSSKSGSSTKSTASQAPSLSKGSTITVKSSATNFSAKSGNVRMASFVPGGKYTVYDVAGNEVLIGLNGVYTGWINKSDIVGYYKGTKSATPGIHAFDELGTEAIFESSDGTKYKLFTGGEKVLDAKSTNFLYDFATGGVNALSKMIKSILGGGAYGNINPIITNNDISLGDIIIQGNADKATVSEIRRAQRESLETMLKEFNRLNRKAYSN